MEAGAHRARRARPTNFATAIFFATIRGRRSPRAQKKAWLRAQMFGTEQQLTTFESRWKLRPDKLRRVHNLPRVNRKRGI